MAVLPPLPYAHPERLVSVWQRADAGRVATSYPKLALLRDRSRTLELAAFKWVKLAHAQGDLRRPLTALAVTPEFFAILGAQPLVGRLFTDDDDRVPLQAPVVVVSEAFWRERLDARPDVVGSRIQLNDVSFTVVGVAARGFPGYSGIVYRWVGYSAEDVWIPSMMAPVGMLADWRTAKTLEEPNAQIWCGLGRIRGGFALRDVLSDLARAGAEVQRTWPESASTWPVPFEAVPLAEEAIDPRILKVVSALQAAGLLIALLGAVNVAALFAARLSARDWVLAVERALGASRSLLLWGTVAEAACVGALGGACALALVRALIVCLRRVEPDVVASPFGLTLEQAAWGASWRVAGLALGLGLAVAVMGCALPVWRQTHSTRLGFWRAGAGITGRGFASLRPNRSSGALVLVELCLALALTAPSLLLVRSVGCLVTADLGFRSADTVTLPVTLSASIEPQTAARFFEDAVEVVVRQQGIERAAWIDGLPLTGTFTAQLERSGSSPRKVTAFVRVVSPGAFEALGIRLLKGRDFGRHDAAGSGAVAVLGESAARQLQAQVGESLAAGILAPRPIEIIGIAADVPYDDPVKVLVPAVYRPLAQAPRNEGVIVARQTPGREPGAAAIVSAVSSLPGSLGPLRALPLREHVGRQLARFRAAAWLLGAGALLALLLAGAGVYGTLSSLVARSVAEIAIRVSLGATPSTIGRRLVAATLELAGIGLVLGGTVGLALSKPLDGYLYGLTRRDPWTGLLATAVAALLALIAASAPARRAMRVDIAAALRQE